MRSAPRLSPTSHGKALIFPLVVTEPEVMEFPMNSINALGLVGAMVLAPAERTKPWKTIWSA